MNFKKIGILAVLAVGAAALIMPAAAAALSNWKDKGVNITSHATIPVSGNFSFAGSLGGVSCGTVTSSLTLAPGSTGTITSFNPTLKTCKGTGGLSGCTLSKIDINKLPWTIHNELFQISVTGIEMRYTMFGFLCPSELTISSSISVNGLELVPDNPNAIARFRIRGYLAASVGGNVIVEGELVPTNAGDFRTYGV